jgi:hypothetical protein
MSAEMLAKKNANAAAYRSTHVLLDNAADTIAGGEAEIAFAGDYILSVSGDFATATTVNIYVKRVTNDDFDLLTDLKDGTTGQYTEKGDVSLLCEKGDKFKGQLSGITGTPAISVKLTFIKN